MVRSHAPKLLLAGVAVAVALVATGCGSAPPASTSAMSGAGAEPLVLTSVQPSIAEHYRFAQEHMDVFSQIPCYCGCDSPAFNHRHLGDCFVRADGRGWEAHGAGCGVCLSEAQTVRAMLADGADVDTIRAAIDQTFAPPTTAPGDNA